MSKIILCLYSYDPLDRLIGTLSSTNGESHRFYHQSQLVTEIQSTLKRSIFQYNDRIMAEYQIDKGIAEAALLATDQKLSILQALSPNDRRELSYSPYGYHSNNTRLLLGFNGQRKDPTTGNYILGIGHRTFNTTLMRFNSPDLRSPFEDGGPNAYAYCGQDPTNYTDATGQVRIFASATARDSLLKKIAEGRISKPIVQSKVKGSSAAIVDRGSNQTKNSRSSHANQTLQTKRSIGYTYQKKVDALENAGILNEKITLHTPVSELTHSKQLLENHVNMNFPFRNGIPMNEGNFTVPNGMGNGSVLYTKHFDASIDYYRNLSAYQRATNRPNGSAEYRLRVSRANRAQYIIRNLG